MKRGKRSVEVWKVCGPARNKNFEVIDQNYDLGKEKKGSTGTSVFIDLVLLHPTQTCPAYWYA